MVPAHWMTEVLNGPAGWNPQEPHQARARRNISGRTGTVADRGRSSPQSRSIETVLAISNNHGLTIYDAAYLELAAREQLPLATLEEDLRRAAVSESVVLL
jgi:hypothetical protein